MSEQALALKDLDRLEMRNDWGALLSMSSLIPRC
jgi:hypothetical protein